VKRVIIIAGESSGDLHGSALMRQMKSLVPDIEFMGIGGSLMIKENLKAIRHVHEMNFMGLTEIVCHLPFIYRTLRDLKSLINSWQPHLVILIDYPGFNFKFAPIVKQYNIPIMYYISPQLWAWHKRRISMIKKYVNRMVVFFDFEREFYRCYGIEADFVGHPLLDLIHLSETKKSFRNSLGVDENTFLIGLFPGSRMQEIERIFPPMVESIRLLKKMIGSITVVTGCAPEIDDGVFMRYIKNKDIIILRGKAYDIMAHSDALVVTSGTATLEAGILGTPMVIVYRTSLLTYLMGRAVVKISNMGLINIVAGSKIVPELCQHEVTPENISAIVEKLLVEPQLRDKIKHALEIAKNKLGTPGASNRAAHIALDLMKT